MKDGLPSDGVLLVVQGEDNMGGVLESLVGAPGGMISSLPDNTNSKRGQNWTVM